MKLPTSKIAKCRFWKEDPDKNREHKVSRFALCSNPKHGGMCGHPGQASSWRCKLFEKQESDGSQA